MGCTLSSNHTALTTESTTEIIYHKHHQKIHLLLCMSGASVCLNIQSKFRYLVFLLTNVIDEWKKWFTRVCPSLAQKLFVNNLSSNFIFLLSSWTPGIYSSAQVQLIWFRKKDFEDPVWSMHDSTTCQWCLLNSFQRHRLLFYESFSSCCNSVW